MKHSQKLLIYRAMGQYYALRTAVGELMLLSLLVFDLTYYSLLGWERLFLWGLAFLLAVFFFYYAVGMRQAAVQVRSQGVVVKGPFFSLSIRFDRVRAVLPVRISQELGADEVRGAEWRWLGDLYNEPAAMIEVLRLDELATGKRWRMHRFLFALERPGLLLLVPDWVELSKAVEQRRATWEQPADYSLAEAASPRTEINVAGSDAPLVLIVDDNAAHRNHLQKLLAFRYRLVFAENGVTGMRTARDRQPDLIVTEARLSGLDGLAMLRAIRKNERLADVPVVFITDEANARLRVPILQAGGNEHLIRPYADEELRLRLQVWMRVRTREQDLHRQNEQLHSKTLSQMGELVRRGQLLNFLPTSVADHLMSGDIKSEGHTLQRQKVTVLFIDIVSFTTLAGQLEPSVLAELLNEYLREMTAIAIEFDGTVDKFIGDAVMVLFGAPNECGEAEQAWNATRAALKMVKVVDEMSMIWEQYLPRELQVRVGVNTGYCTAGVFGNELLKSYTVVGSAVNIAARLQTAAPPGRIVCSAETYEWVKNKVIVRPMGELDLKGVSHPVPGYELVAVPEHVNVSS